MRNEIDHIKDNLLAILESEKNFCDEILGEGGIGIVRQRRFGDSVKITFRDCQMKIPIVIKQNKSSEGQFKMDMIDSKLYLSSYKDITAEAIMCAFLSCLWYEELSPHIQLTIGFNKCHKNPQIIDQIVSEYQGLTNAIDLYSDIKYIDRTPFFHQREMKQSSRLSTLEELCQYIVINKTGKSIHFPNGIICDIIELLDSLLLSFIHTAYLLYQESGLILNDMHAGNLLINWISSDTFLGTQDLSDLQMMEYNIRNSVYQINTHGILLKFGDIGSCLMNPRDDLWILGQCPHIEKTLDHLDLYAKHPYISFFSTFTSIASNLSREILSETILNHILQSDPFNKFNKNIPFDKELIEKLPSPFDLIADHFSRFVLNEKN